MTTSTETFDLRADYLARNLPRLRELMATALGIEIDKVGTVPIDAVSDGISVLLVAAAALHAACAVDDQAFLLMTRVTLPIGRDIAQVIPLRLDSVREAAR